MKLTKHLTVKNWQRNLAIGAIVALSGTVAAHADESQSSSPPKYQANELSLDLFGTGSAGRETLDNISGDRVKQEGRLGAGLGLTYFITEHIGISADGYSENVHNSFVDGTAANLILRLPLGNSGFAPYIFGGGGYQFDPTRQWIADAGAGLEFRVTHNWGFFVDARYVFADESDDYGLARAGVRLTF